MQIDPSPVVEQGGRFYFYDEVWADACGPYDTRAAANAALTSYSLYLETGEAPDLGGGAWGQLRGEP